MAKAIVHLLDVGHIEYGDSILVEVGGRSVLIDGGKKASGRRTTGAGIPHPSIPEQVKSLLGQPAGGGTAAHVDLLVITHCHSDHIGCPPDLVTRGRLTCDWALMADPDLGFGRLETDPDEPEPDAMPLARKIAYALREQPLGRLSDQALNDAIEDQAGQYQEYVELLSQLQQQIGERMVLYRGPTEASSPGLAALLSEFEETGLQVAGPEPRQLALCAQVIRDRFVENVAEAERRLRTDSARLSSPVALYRDIVAGRQDAEADGSSDGKALNCQSILLRFANEGRSVLLCGDMQFADPGLGAAVRAEMAELIDKVTAGGPYDFIKISHHGSHNGFNSALRTAWGARFFGISTGANSGGHPHAVILNVLRATPGAQWIRNDRNGQCRFDFSDGGAELGKERGEFNDSSGPAGADDSGPEAEPGEGAVEVRRNAVVGSPGTGAADMIEVVARIPNRRTRVTLTIDVAPGEGGGEPPGSFSRLAAPGTGLGGGRALPPLLFVTNPEALARNVGRAEAAEALALLEGQRVALIGESRPAEAVARVQAELERNPQTEGVVLLGGYDVVPSLVLDVLPGGLRREVEYEEDDDADDYFVWSDDAYADRNRDGVPELPVSRIPDGCSYALFRSALTAQLPPRFGARCGVRNMARPFAEEIFLRLPGSRPLPSADPVRKRTVPADLLEGDIAYLMLHGDALDARVLFGEDRRRGHHPAVDLGHLPRRAPAVVFTGACWGALTVDTLAADHRAGSPLGVRGPDQSIALRSLLLGANAFVGCTGSHYSPRPGEGLCFGAPMHRYFFDALMSGAGPARALYQAKGEYRRRLPHSGKDEDRAVEYKILRQFTCLGLGW